MRYLRTYKIFEGEFEQRSGVEIGQRSDRESDEMIKDTVYDILQDCVDDGVHLLYYPPNTFWVKDIDSDVFGLCVSLYCDYEFDIKRTMKFIDIKSSVEHLISYMKSIGYNNFYYRDDETYFNQHNRRHNSDVKSEINHLPGDTDPILDVKITFIRNGIYSGKIFK